MGFGARLIKDGQPKYLNSPETLLFNKRNLLFGLNESKKYIRQNDYAIIVEGYMDAIALASHNIANSVASLGTAFTAEQCKKILRYTSNIYFCYDGDSAGQNATLRALSIARGQHAAVKVILLPDGSKDPDEFLQKHDAAAFNKLIDNAVSFIDFHLHYIMQTIDYTSLEGKLKAVSFILPILSSIDNLVESNAYAVKVSQTLGIDETDLRNELQKYRKHNNQSSAPSNFQISQTINSAGDSAAIKAGRHIITRIWQEPDVLDYILATTPINEFENKQHREILTFLTEQIHNNNFINDITASEKLSDDSYTELSRCLVEKKNTNESKLLDDYLKIIHRAHLEKSYLEHSLRADELERSGDDRFQQELIKIQRIRKEMDGVK